MTEYCANSAQQVAGCLMRREGLLNRKWSYDYGVVWRGMEALVDLTGDIQYAEYIHQALDTLISPDGAMAGYDLEAYNLDYLCIGRQLIWLWRRTGEEKYRLAVKTLMRQLEGQPRTTDGGFWHKKVYPYQMWLDGQHMAIPFYVEAAIMLDMGKAKLEDAAYQLLLAWKHTVNPDTGLPCHGWDERRTQIWADKETGRSAHSWGRAVGWYMMALVDTLLLLPRETPGYAEVLEVYQTLSHRLVEHREEGVWLQVLDCPGRMGNYAESSASCLICCALLKGAEKGLLPAWMGEAAQESFLSIQRHFLGRMRDGTLFIAKCCMGAGLGGSTQRDGSFDYYISETVNSFDLKATGAYIQAACAEQRMRGETAS